MNDLPTPHFSFRQTIFYFIPDFSSVNLAQLLTSLKAIQQRSDDHAKNIFTLNANLVALQKELKAEVARLAGDKSREQAILGHLVREEEARDAKLAESFGALYKNQTNILEAFEQRMREMQSSVKDVQTLIQVLCS